MKKILSIFIIVIFLISVLGIFYKFTGYVPSEIKEESYKKIDPVVLDQLEKEENVDVIVNVDDEIKTKRNFLGIESSSDPDKEREKIIRKFEKEKVHKFNSSNSFSVELSKKEIENLALNKEVKKIDYDYPVKLFLNDAIDITNASSTWLLQVSGINLTGLNQAVCVIDTGVDYSHPDLGGCFGSGCKVIGGYDTAEDDSDPRDNHGHGTHIAGIIAANGNIKGLAPDSNIVAMKVFTDSGSSLTSYVIKAIDWCVDNSSVYNISAITMSIGLVDAEQNPILRNNYCDAEFSGLAAAIDNAVSKNITVSISTGNDYNTTHIGVPACIENATAVAASDKQDNIADYSNINNMTDLIAPGSSINSTWINGYRVSSGTSMATPMVAGAVSLIKQFLYLSGQTKTPREIISILNETGKNIDYIGLIFSRINIYNATLSIDNLAPDTTLISPEDNNINLSQDQSFICDTIDWQLANVTFYLWNSTDLIYNESKNIQGTANTSVFNLSDLSYDSYEWNCLVSDIKGNSDFSVSNFTLHLGGIITNLLNPAEIVYTNQGENNFTCQSESEATYGLANVTFYLWNSSNLVYNESRNIQGTANTSIFNYTFTFEDNYKWNCLSFNNNSNSSFALSNHTLVYDTTEPDITLLSPNNDYSTTSTSINFQFNVIDNLNISSCRLIITGTESSIVSNQSEIINPNTIQTSLSVGEYEWQINCTDNADNTGDSSIRTFIINSPAVRFTSGGGGTTSTPESIEISETEEYKELGTNEKIIFETSVKKQKHTLTIKYIGEDFVELTIETNPIELTLSTGQEIKLNLSSLDYYDLYIKLGDIVDKKAKIIVKTINEPIKKESAEGEMIETPKSERIQEKIRENLIYIIVLIFVAALLISFIIKKIILKKNIRKH